MNWVSTLHINVARYMTLYLAGMAYQAASQAEHRAILAACRQGKIELACEQLRQHLQAAASQLVQVLQQSEG
jgi:DNA-binding FadR family transcriptional regulator